MSSLAIKRLLRAFCLSALLLPVAWGQPTTQPVQRAASADMTKREWKEQKWKSKMEAGEQRQEKLQEHIRQLQTKGTQTSLANPQVAHPQQLAEDFDWSVNWDQKDSRGVHPQIDYGYSTSNHLASAGCAPGEIGGSIGGGAISWFADNVARGGVMLDTQIPLAASGWCSFTAIDGSANVGWFNSVSYEADDGVPHTFVGWRQEGLALRASIGTTGKLLVDGAPIPISSGQPFQWTLKHNPSGGDAGCGQITLTVSGSSS